MVNTLAYDHQWGSGNSDLIGFVSTCTPFQFSMRIQVSSQMVLRLLTPGPCCAACTATRGQHLPTTTAAGASPQAGCPPSPIAADAQVSKGCLQSHCLEPNQGFSSSDAGSSLSPPLLPWVPGSVFKSLCLIYRKSFSSMCWLILCPLWVNWPVGLSWRQTPHCLLHHSPQPLPVSVQAKLPSQKLFPQWKSTHAKDTSSLPTLTLHDIYCLNP